MANKKISAFSAAAALGGTEQIAGVQSGGNVAITPAQITTYAAPVGANPTATASDTAVNGTAVTFLRSDGAPAIQKVSSSVFGLAKVDGTSITASGGVISAVASGSGAVLILGQSGIPFVMPGSGLMIANGVGTLTTALGQTYTSAYFYFAANAIASGVAAGWYYTVMSSTTAFTVYNNTYTIGTPTIPGSPTAFSTASPVTYTGSSSAITAYNLSIAGNTLGINGGLSVWESLSVTNSAATKTVAAAFGATTFYTSSTTTSLSTTQQIGFRNRGAAGAQVSFGPASGSNIALGNTAVALTFMSEDTTATKTLAIVMTNATPATNNMVLEQVTVELLPGVT